MLGALKSIKFVVMCGVVIVVLILWILLEASNSKQDVLRSELNQVKQNNMINQTTIKALNEEQYKTNLLLVNRQKTHSKVEKKLNENIKFLKEKLSKNECYLQPWPPDVIERLRSDY